ncbi:MAG: TetR/AcrR family transcriptional regulator, partial [Mesorhizobium sp.]
EAGGEGGTDPDRFAALTVAAYSGAMSMAKTAQDAGVLRQCLEGLERVEPPPSQNGSPAR